MKGYDYLSFLARFFHLKELEELSLRSAPSGVEEVKADTSVNTYARVLALTPKSTCRLITPLNERFVVSLSILLLFGMPPDNLGNNCWNDANMRATGVQTEYRNENFHS